MCWDFCCIWLVLHFFKGNSQNKEFTGGLVGLGLDQRWFFLIGWIFKALLHTFSYSYSLFLFFSLLCDPKITEFWHLINDPLNKSLLFTCHHITNPVLTKNCICWCTVGVYALLLDLARSPGQPCTMLLPSPTKTTALMTSLWLPSSRRRICKTQPSQQITSFTHHNTCTPAYTHIYIYTESQYKS